MTLAELAANLEDVTWQDARTFTAPCRKHGSPCRAKAHGFTRHVYLSCDTEKTLTEAEFTGDGEQPAVATDAITVGSLTPKGAPSNAIAPIEDATAPASGERAAGAANTPIPGAGKQPGEDSRVAPAQGAVKRGTVRQVPYAPNGAGRGASLPALRTPNVTSWKLNLYDRVKGECDGMLDKAQLGPDRELTRGVLASSTLENWVASLNKHRNLPSDGLTLDPALTPVEIDEELQWLATQLQDTFKLSVPTVQNGTAVRLLELPDLSRKEIEPLRWSDMRQRRAAQQREWVVDGLLARGEMSSWAGKVEAGKTTLMRELTLCVIRGESFLGRQTQRGKVAYLMLDADGEEETYDEFDKLGFNEEDGDNTLFIFEPMLAQIENGLEKLVKMLLDFGPTLAVIDPYPRLKKIEDFTGYENTYLMGQLSHVARLVRAHFALPGHIPRGRDDDADVATAGFGSISFSGGVNARFTVTNRKGTHTIRSSKGKGSRFKAFDAEYVTQQDEMTNRIVLGAPWSWKDKARSYMEVVQQFLDSHEDRPFDVVTLAKEIRAQKSVLRTAANMLFGHQKIKREGDGLKSAPYIYGALAYHGKLTMEEVKRD